AYTLFSLFLLRRHPPPRSPLFPYTTLFRSCNTSSKLRMRWRAPRRRKQTSAPSQTRCKPRSPSSREPPDVRGDGLRSNLFNAERSEEHTSELQSPCNLVCRLLLEKKKKTNR